MSATSVVDFFNCLKRQRVVLAILLLATLLRVVLLEIKPPHFDEGVNGWFVDEMVKSGYFHYDPENYHGPLHFYILFLSQTLFGRHIWALRLPAVLASLATIWLATRFDRFIPRRACLLAALAIAVSPAEVFYARYAIHETELAFFLLLTTWGIGSLWQSGERKGLWAVGLGLTGMILTKETYIIHVACFALTGLCLWAWEKITPSPFAPTFPKQLWNRRDLAVVAGCSVVLVLFFYSGGFLDPGSLKGLYQTYAAWVKTGTNGNGHEKPWHYWLYLIAKFEWPVAIGLVFGAGWTIIDFFNTREGEAPSELPSPVWKRLLGGFGLSRRLGRSLALPYSASQPARFLAIYGIGALAAYCLVPYKTPWCIVTIAWPFFLLFGIAVDSLWESLGKRAAMILCAPLLGASLGLSIWLNFYHYTDESIPYVYVQTTDDLRKLTGPLFKMTTLDPANYAMRGHIMLGSYYPLPWVLGDFTRLGYFNSEKTPEIMDADFLLVDADRVEKTEDALKEAYFKEPLRLRSAMEPAELYLRESKFRCIFPDRTPEFQPK